MKKEKKELKERGKQNRSKKTVEDWDVREGQLQ
jgi:hypothetical protein